MALIEVRALARVLGLRPGQVGYVEATDAVEALLQSGVLEPTGEPSTRSRDALYARAQELDISGRSKMDVGELDQAINEAELMSESVEPD